MEGTRVRRIVTIVLATIAPVACSSGTGAAEPTATTTSTTTGTTTTTTISSTTTSTTISSTTTTSTTSTTTTVPAWQNYPSVAVEPLTRPGQPVARVGRVETTDRVVFLTIDDGIHRDPRIPQFLVDHQMPASLFLVRGPLLEDPEYFRAFLASGSTINSHTLNHPELPDLSYERQKSEICGMAQAIRDTYGFSGALFRPPYGSWNDDTKRAAASCGLAAVVTWNSELWEGVVDLAHRPALQPGDIFLTHFRPDLYDNLVSFAARVEAEGFTVALLDRYLLPPVSGESR